MFHFRTNVYPTPSDKVTNRSSHHYSHHPTSRSSPSKPTASSIHCNVKSPLQSSLSFDQAQPGSKRRETAAQIRQRKINEYKHKKWTSKEKHHANIVMPNNNKEEEKAKFIPRKAFSYDDAPLGVRSSLSSTENTDFDSIFRSSSSIRNNGSNGVLEHDGSDSSTSNNLARERTAGWNNTSNNENENMFKIHRTGAENGSPVSSFDEGEAHVGHVRRLNKNEKAAQVREKKVLEYQAKRMSSTSPVASFDEYEAQVGHVHRLTENEKAAQVREKKVLEYQAKKMSSTRSFDEYEAHIRRLNENEKAAQVREKKLLEYQAKKMSASIGTNLPTNSPTSTLMDVGVGTTEGLAANNWLENRDSMIQTNASFDGQPKPKPTGNSGITRARTTDWFGDNKDTMDIQRTGSDGILVVSDPTFDERMKVTSDRAHRLGELYAMQAAAVAAGQEDDDPIVGLSNKFESSAEIRQRKIQEYNSEHHGGTESAADVRQRMIHEYETKKLENCDAVFKVGPSSSTQYRHGQTNHRAPAGGITRARTTDSDDGYASVDDIHRTGSFDERSRASLARSDRLSELYAMQEGRNNAVFRTEQKTSIMGALSYESKVCNSRPTGTNIHETAAQIRQRKIREYKQKKHAEGMHRQVALSSSFDSSVIFSSEVDDQAVEISLPESYSFDDAGDFVPSVNYDLPSLC